jgi:hypothetical protein
VKAGQAPEPIIDGSALVKANTEVTYAVEDPQPNSRYSWHVTGASSFEQQGGEVLVTWGTVEGTVRVMETDNVFGCRAVDELVIVVDPTTVVGVDDDIIRSGVRVYPNPTPDYLEIESSVQADVTVHIYDLTGKGYGYQVVHPHSLERVNLTSLPRGIYILKLSAKGIEGESVLRVVKQ